MRVMDSVVLENNRKREVKRKWWVRSQPQETGGSHPGWNQGDRPPDAEENLGSRYRQSLEGQVS